MNFASKNRTTRRKTLLLSATALALLFIVWIIWGFDRGGSDEAKYRRMRRLARNCQKISEAQIRLPAILVNLLPLKTFRSREALKYSLLRIELLASGYLTNVTFEATNLDATRPLIENRLMTNFAPNTSPMEIQFTGVKPSTPSSRTMVTTYFLTTGPLNHNLQLLNPEDTPSPEMVTITCRSQDLERCAGAVSGDPKAPAKVLRMTSKVFEGDVPAMLR